MRCVYETFSEGSFLKKMQDVFVSDKLEMQFSHIEDLLKVGCLV